MSDGSPTPPVAVQFGAGNIGRGFMGELFQSSGYRTVFVDVDHAVVDALRARGVYDIHHVTTEHDVPVRIAGVTALDARDTRAVAGAVAGASVVCTAVGVRTLPAVAPALAQGILLRLRDGAADPLNVITCENLVGAGRILRDLVWSEIEKLSGHAPPLSRTDFDSRFGFVEAVVSRMVPLVPDEVRRRDPLWVACEPYARLPVDGKAFRGPVPRIAGLEPVADILAYQRRKLASHNMSHATAAYLGYAGGHEFIWQAMADDAVLRAVRASMDETGRALVSRFGFDPAEQRDYEEDLLQRYRNRALGDQVRRVAADPLRKLGREDRLIGSARLCLEEDVEPAHLLVGIRAALAYNNPDDPAAVRLQEMLAMRGREAVLREVCGLAPDEPLFARLRE
ncbi:MAG: mannitol-1-phosphate 5-dehydrogenase [Planctomycetota bacterium]|nr:mannitol-1-phosphate 5-dehydrogenase [Planctomycetota bacterium]